MKTLLIALLLLTFSSIPAKDMEKTQLLKVSAAQLQQLEYKVSGRDDVTREEVRAGLHRYLIKDRFETYYFTTAEHPAHWDRARLPRIIRPGVLRSQQPGP